MRNPRRTLCAVVLCLEAIALGLATPVLVSLTSLPLGWALGIGLGLALLCLIAAGLLRSPAGYVLGTLVQFAALSLGLIVPQAAIVAVIFGALWATAWWLGRLIERERAAATATGA